MYCYILPTNIIGFSYRTSWTVLFTLFSLSQTGTKMGFLQIHSWKLPRFIMSLHGYVRSWSSPVLSLCLWIDIELIRLDKNYIVSFFMQINLIDIKYHFIVIRNITEIAYRDNLDLFYRHQKLFQSHGMAHEYMAWSIPFFFLIRDAKRGEL